MKRSFLEKSTVFFLGGGDIVESVAGTFSGAHLTPLEPKNPSLYSLPVNLSPKRVSSCKGVNHP